LFLVQCSELVARFSLLVSRGSFLAARISLLVSRGFVLPTTYFKIRAIRVIRGLCLCALSPRQSYC